MKMVLFFVFPIYLNGQDTIDLVFAGDIMGHESQILSAKTGFNQYDYKPCFKYIKPILENADLAIGNLEVTLPGRWPYTGFIVAPIFRSPDALAEALKDAGFDVLTTANNHANDSQRKGIRNTIETLRNLNIYQTGTFLNAEDRALRYPLLVQKNGFSLVFLNYSSVGTNYIPTIKPTIVNLFDTVKIKKDFNAARKLKADFIIVLMHWGIEHNIDESEDQILQAEFLARQGADIIVGTHPHVVQPIRQIEVWKEDGSDHQALVAYSLGNFISNHHMPNTKGGIMLYTKLIRQTNIEKPMIETSCYIPVWRHICKDSFGKKIFTLLPIPYYLKFPQKYMKLNESSLKEMEEFSQNLKERLDFPVLVTD